MGFQRQTASLHGVGQLFSPDCVLGMADDGQDPRKRLNQLARHELRSVLGVVEFWLAPPSLEGDRRVD
jgi:hypothetical protein